MNSPTILIVEDDDSIRETLNELLVCEGFNVRNARHGREALDKLSADEAPSVILLDLMMPVMSGWEFLDATEKDSKVKDIPVIILSAVSDTAQGTRAQGFLGKPVDAGILIDEINRLCAKARKEE